MVRVGFRSHPQFETHHVASGFWRGSCSRGWVAGAKAEASASCPAFGGQSRLVGWLVGWSVGRSVGWLVGWLPFSLVIPREFPTY